MKSKVALPFQSLRVCPGRLVAVAASVGLFLVSAWHVAAQTSPATLPDLKLSRAGYVGAIALQEDGKIIIGGFFTTVNEVPRVNLARLNPNGSVDLTWNPPSPNSPVSCLLIEGDALFIGGSFGLVGADSCSFLAKLQLTDSGSLDIGYRPAANNYDGEVRTLAMSGGYLYVGGAFTNIGGQNLTNLARISPQGAGLADANWRPSPDNSISTLLGSGPDIFVGGSFTRIGGADRVHVAKLSAMNSGSAAPDWNAGFSVTNAPITALALNATHLFVGGASVEPYDGVVRKLEVLSGGMDPLWSVPVAGPVNTLSLVGGSVFVGGDFSNIGGDYAAGFLAKVSTSSTGAVDHGWSASFVGSASDTPTIGCLVVAGSWLFVGGQFNVVNGKVRLGLAKVDKLSGIADDQLSAQVESPGFINALARQRDGKVIVGGEFSFAGGLPRRNLARVNGDGTLDGTWAPDADGPINALALLADSVFVGGEFNNVGGLNRNCLAKVLVAGGDRADPAWDAKIPPAAVVSALACLETNLFVGGAFGTIGGVARVNLAKLRTTGDGAVDSLWQADTDYVVGAVTINGADLFVGGYFLTVGGVARTNMAKVSTLGTGTVDADWHPGFPRADVSQGSVRIHALAVSGTNLFVGGSFSNIAGIPRGGLAKVSTVGPATVDANWNPGTDLSDYPEIKALLVDGTNLYVGGQFSELGGQPVQALARLSINDAGDADPDFHPFQPASYADVRALLLSGQDIYVGGAFTGIGGGEAVPAASRNGFALLAKLDAPNLAHDGAGNLFVTRNPNDGPEVTHFQIIAISGVSLFLNDGLTPVSTNDFITVAQGAAGLKYIGTAGTVAAVSALNNTDKSAVSASSAINLGVPPQATFSFAAPTFSVKEGVSISIPVRKQGTNAASVRFATLDGTAIGGRDYLSRSGTLNFSLTETQKNLPVIATGNDFAFTGDRSFSVVLSDPSSGAGLMSPVQSVVTIIDDDGVGNVDSYPVSAAPAPAIPIATAVLTVELQPTEANGQWRLPGELNWHNSGAAVSGLVKGNYSVEFRPANGYRQPEVQTLPVSADQTNAFIFYYAATSALETGSLAVTIKPNDVATNSDPGLRGYWRRQGGPTNWLNGGDVVTNLKVGSYVVEFSSVAGRLTPSPKVVEVGANANYGALVTYLLAPGGAGAQTPAVVPFSTATSNSPYRYNGQLQTSIGFASGVVVKRRVVVTAGHALFDDVSLNYTTTARWFFQRYRDQLEPVPLIPRGWYVFDGYASQRQLDKTPGVSTPESQTFDAAALYFLEDAGRGGFGGYLSSDQSANEFLTGNANKFLAGYPLDGVPDADQSKLHATSPTDLVFFKTHDQVYATDQIKSYPGNSGGPLYVQHDDGAYYPAGIFLGGSGGTLVRAINGEIVDLINRAEVSGNGGGNSTGGGAVPLSPGQTISPIGTGILNVSLTPSNLPNFRPGWRIGGLTDTNYFDGSALTTVAVIGGGNYPIEFKSIPGFLTPGNRTVSVAVGGLVTIQADYVPVYPQLGFSRATGLSLSGDPGATYRVEFTTNLTAPVTWTPLTTLKLLTSSVTLSNTQLAPTGQRFYRSILVP